MKSITAIMICLYLTSCTKKSDVGGEDPLAASKMRAQAPHAVELGWQYFNKGDYGTAMRRFQMAVRHDPSHAPAYYGIAYVYSVQNKLDDAIKYYRLTLEHDQTYPYTFANLGYALTQNNETEEGLRMLDKALQLKPDCGEAHLSYANYYASKQQWRKAQESANSAIKCGLVIHPELKKLLEANGVKLTGPQKNSYPGDTPSPHSPSAPMAGGR